MTQSSRSRKSWYSAKRRYLGDSKKLHSLCPMYHLIITKTLALYSKKYYYYHYYYY